MIEAFDGGGKGGGVVADVHLKIDTGMGRLGIRCDEVSEFLEALKKFENIRVDGVMTHLAAADDPAHEGFTQKQLNSFEVAVKSFREHGFSPTYIHAANSAAIFSYPQQPGAIMRPVV